MSKNNKLTYDQVMSYKKDSAVFTDKALAFYDDLSTTICKRIIGEATIKDKFAIFDVDDSEVRGVGVESIIYADSEPVEVTKKNCCTSICDNCDRVLHSRVLKNLPWQRICDKFSEEQLYENFCKGDDYITTLLNRLITAQNNDRIRWLNKKAISIISDINSYWIDKVKGQVIETDKPEVTLYKLIAELVEGSEKYNEIGKYYETTIDQIVVISNAENSTDMADRLSMRCRSLFEQCGIAIECRQIKWIIAPISNIDYAIYTIPALKRWTIFQRVKTRELENCLIYAHYLHFKNGVARDSFYDAIGVKKIKSDNPDLKNANEFKDTINAIAGLDLTVIPSANTQSAAEIAVKAVIDDKFADKKGLTFDYVFSDYKEAISVEQSGSINVIVNIKKDNKVLASTNLKTFILTYKA